MNNFTCSLEVVLHHEGGYVNHPADPGGETIYGISRRSHPEVWIKGRPSIEEAKAIYHRDYWLPIKADALPLPVALITFDSAVNCGCFVAAKFLQRALNIADDGIIGPVTLSAANRADSAALVNAIAGQRIVYSASLRNWNSFGLGWSRRIVDVATKAALLTK
ncbi:glycoside hydrolase family 108 protein [Rheinheimera fenheensis]|uniref:glycoside hydrolase family 108 protein n=1 Tax=Rheinheimera fenheensis TaxID=3152295 RepID=UPI003260F44D